MANINFPSNPTASQTYTFGSTTWTYNGNAWVAGGGSIGAQGFTGPQGFQGLQGPTGPSDIINIYDVNDGTLVSGTTNNTLSDSVLISANSVTIGNFLELKTRYRITGNANTKTVRFYIGTASQISGANLVGTSGAIGGSILTGTMNRTLAIKSATQSESYPSTSAAHSDEGVIVAAAVTSTNIDWTLDQYFIVAIQLTSSGDSARTSFSKVTIYN